MIGIISRHVLVFHHADVLATYCKVYIWIAVLFEQCVFHGCSQHLYFELPVATHWNFSFHSSKFLYDITRSDSTNPAASVVRIWLEKLAKQIGVAFRYTERLHGVLVKRVSYLKMKMKNLKDRNSFNNFGNWSSIKMRLKHMPWATELEPLSKNLWKQKNRMLTCWYRSSKYSLRKQLLKQSCVTCLQSWRLISTRVEAEAAASLLRTIQNHTSAD